jgi:tetratricopeptide (TPR) repeat protein
MLHRYSRAFTALILVVAVCAAAPRQSYARQYEEAAKPATSTEARGKAYAHLMRSLFAVRRGAARAAAEEIRSAIDLMPESSDVRIQGARLLLAIDRWTEAEELGRQALQLDPENVDAIRFVADRVAERASGVSQDEDSRQEAIALYRKLLERDEADEQVLRNMIGLHLQAGERQGALEVARKLVAMRPGDRQATGLLTQLLLERQESEEALGVVLDYLAGHPGEIPLARLAGELAREIEGWEMVAGALSELPTSGRASADVQKLMAEALIRTGNMAAGTAALEALLEQDPLDRETRYNLAIAYRSVGRLADASELAEALIAESPDDARARFLLADTLDDQRDVRGALDAFAALLDLFSERADDEAASIREAIRRRMIQLHLMDGQISVARSLSRGLEQLDHPETIETVSRLAIAAGDWAAARQAAQRLRLSGEVGAAATLEAEVLILTGKWTKADARVEEAVQTAGPTARTRLAELFLDAGKPSLGEALLREWAEADAADADAGYFLGSYLWRAGRLEDGERELRRTIRLDPSHAPALNFLGYSLAERGERLEEAVELIESALLVDRWNGAYLDSMGWAYFMMGRYEEARSYLESAAREYPLDGTVLEHLGDLYSLLGEREMALDAWRRALAAGPRDDDQLRSKIEREAPGP